MTPTQPIQAAPRMDDCDFKATYGNNRVVMGSGPYDQVISHLKIYRKKPNFKLEYIVPKSTPSGE